MHVHIQEFWALGDEGHRAYWAFEHINSYVEGSFIQYDRIFDLWKQSSGIPESSSEALGAKSRVMNQVIRDIHFLLVSKQAIWRTLQTLCSAKLYPSFQHLEAVKKNWSPYFDQFKEPRDSFEHFEDQILGKDTRRNSPGFGVRLTANGEFSLGTQRPVLLGADSRGMLAEFRREFEDSILSGLR